MRIDHVLLATQHLEVTSRRLGERYGLVSVSGGVHPQWGTANRIVPLGGPYLEIIGVADPAVARGSLLGQRVQSVTADGHVLAGLMVEPDDFDAVCARLLLSPTPGQRTRPDGKTSSWRLAGLSEALSRGLPSFICWENRDDEFRGDAGIGATGIIRVDLGGDAEEIDAWLGAEVAGLSLVGGARGLRRLTIATSNGDIVLPEHP